MPRRGRESLIRVSLFFSVLFFRTAFTSLDPMRSPAPGNKTLQGRPSAELQERGPVEEHIMPTRERVQREAGNHYLTLSIRFIALSLYHIVVLCSQPYYMLSLYVIVYIVIVNYHIVML